MIVFIVGCATGGVAAQLVVPPVRAGTYPTQWEYQCARVDNDVADATTALRKLGAEGWELVGMAPSNIPGGFAVSEYTVCAKRVLLP